nr:histidine kinase [uncultured Methylophaga sp.]
MNRISLRAYVVALIVGIGFFCLTLVSIWVVADVNKEAEKNSQSALNSAINQVRVQAIRLAVNSSHKSQFPDLTMWTQAENNSGTCLSFFNSLTERTSRHCRGASITNQAPSWFKNLYETLWGLNKEITQTLEYGGKRYGTILVSTNINVIADKAWGKINQLLIYTSSVVCLLGVLLFFAMNYAINPSKKIERSIKHVYGKNLSQTDIPDFFISEFHVIGQAINQLTSKLKKMVEERVKLSTKIVKIQEEERKYISRELHDELGQSLTGLSALTTLISVQAEQKYPDLLPLAQKINKTSEDMMHQLRDILVGLRFTDADDLNIRNKLSELFDDSHIRSGKQIEFHLAIDNEVENIPNDIKINIFRIIQECTTNTIKHSDATNCFISILFKNNESNENYNLLHLQFKDNGTITELNKLKSSGFGIIGIKERVLIFDGTLDFSINAPSGLCMDITLPITSMQREISSGLRSN